MTAAFGGGLVNWQRIMAFTFADAQNESRFADYHDKRTMPLKGMKLYQKLSVQ